MWSCNNSKNAKGDQVACPARLAANTLTTGPFLGVFFKCARIGERLSPYVALACIIMGFRILLA
ncbi:hypothetical protein RHOSPDRAFT_34817 [Rhodotorula sp. JG-1b]|nr:hypothetical protein RHOSPDRAFT_34817 [Rhodotorula sp. JG-1b]